jgi:DNA end-binding protein Ku
MRDKGKAGVARVVISRRERMLLLEPLGKGIMATVLRYPYEVRGEEAYFEDIPDLNLPKEMRDLAGHIIETKAADFEPSKFEDRYENAVIELVKSKESGRPIAAPEAPRPSNVVNLMDALRKSIASEQPVSPKRAASKSKGDAAAAPPKKARSTGRKTG